MTTVLIILAIINLIALTIVLKNQKHILDKIEKAKQIEQYQIVTAFDHNFFCGRELETDDEGRNYFKYVYYTKPGNRGN